MISDMLSKHVGAVKSVLKKWFKINDIQLVHLLVVWWLVNVPFMFRWPCIVISFVQNNQLDASQRPHNRHETYQFPSVQLINPDDGHRRCPKQVEFRDKINFGYLMHLVGYFIRSIYSLPQLYELGYHCDIQYGHTSRNLNIRKGKTKINATQFEYCWLTDAVRNPILASLLSAVFTLSKRFLFVVYNDSVRTAL